MDLPASQIHQTQPAGFYQWLRGFNKRVTNRLTMRFAGKRIYAVIHHRGRKSAKKYQTPVVAMQNGNTFIFPLPYGAHADWCQNVLASGDASLEWRGQWYSLQKPQLINPQEALPAFPGWLRYLLRHTHIYLKLERVDAPFQTLRRILVYGAGVLGSVYAGKLHQAGYDVTLLERGQRLEELRANGLVLIEGGSSRQEHISVKVTDQLGPEDAYELVMVVTRKNQLLSVLPALAANSCTPNVLFLMNNGAGPDELVEALGRERVILGFPGAGGQRLNGVVHYRLASKVQPTTIGELDGQRTDRILQIAQMLSQAGLPASISENMVAWLKTHVALVSPIANALYLAGGSNYRLARTRDGLVLLARAVNEGLAVLRSLKIPITPAKYQALSWLPEPLLVAVLQKGLATPQAELVMARHTNAARDEMQTLADEFRALVRQSGQQTPAIDALYSYIDPHQPPVSEGQAKLKLVWGPMIAAAGAVLSAGILAGWLLKQRSDGTQQGSKHHKQRKG